MINVIEMEQLELKKKLEGLTEEEEQALQNIYGAIDDMLDALASSEVGDMHQK